MPRLDEPRSLALVLGAVLVACGGNGKSDVPDGPNIQFDRPAMLANIGANILLPVYRNFDANADTLVTQIDAYCSALGTDSEAVSLSLAQDQWRKTMTDWQLAEVMLFGPVAMDAKTLRDRIYSWPVTSSCAVDQDVMLRYQDPAGYDISTRLNNRRGLAALEYLLFAPSLDTTCPPQIAPVGWSELADADRRAARCALAADAARDLAGQAQIAVDAWDPEKGNYLADFAGAGTSGSSFDSAQSAVNVVSDAMFYVDSEVKDMKLGQPAGILLNSCNTVQEPCLAELESQFAHSSKENIVSNLRGFEMLFHGGGPDRDPDAPDSLGFEDFLRAAGAEELANTMKADIAAAIVAAETLPGTLDEALVNDYPSVVEAHVRLKAVTDLLKTQFLTVLGLDIPDGAAGDND